MRPISARFLCELIDFFFLILLDFGFLFAGNQNFQR